jgi:hypothetical protein
MWERIVEKQGLDRARKICRDEDDFGFIRNYLDADLADKLGLFVYESKSDDGIKIAARDINAVREAILAPKFNYWRTAHPRRRNAERWHARPCARARSRWDAASISSAAPACCSTCTVPGAGPVMLQTVDSRGSPHEYCARARRDRAQPWLAGSAVTFTARSLR